MRLNTGLSRRILNISPSIRHRAAGRARDGELAAVDVPDLLRRPPRPARPRGQPHLRRQVRRPLDRVRPPRALPHHPLDLLAWTIETRGEGGRARGAGQGGQGEGGRARGAGRGGQGQGQGLALRTAGAI